MILESKSTDSETKSVLLAVESLKHKETLQGFMAIDGELTSLPHHSNSIAILRHEGRVNAVTFSPDGKTLATASSDNTARIWDANKGLPITYTPSTGETG